MCSACPQSRQHMPARRQDMAPCPLAQMPTCPDAQTTSMPTCLRAGFARYIPGPIPLPGAEKERGTEAGRWAAGGGRRKVLRSFFVLPDFWESSPINQVVALRHGEARVQCFATQHTVARTTPNSPLSPHPQPLLPSCEFRRLVLPQVVGSLRRAISNVETCERRARPRVRRQSLSPQNYKRRAQSFEP